jgi:hypothetical protein
MQTCATCAHWAPKRTTPEQTAMAKVNLFLCDLGTRWTFLPAHRTCERYQAAPADVVEKRLAWLARK